MFLQVILFEAFLFVIAWLLAWAFDIPLNTHLEWDWKGWAIGFTSMLPMVSLFFWLLQSQWPPCLKIRQIMQTAILPIFKGFSLIQILLLSCVAGVSEEVLFRGVIQGGLESVIGTPAAILFSALLFGLCHALTGFYFVLATLMGIYLSLVWMASDQLMSPIVTHAAYDFFVLTWYLNHPGSAINDDTNHTRQ